MLARRPGRPGQSGTPATRTSKGQVRMPADLSAYQRMREAFISSGGEEGVYRRQPVADDQVRVVRGQKAFHLSRVEIVG